MSSNLSDVQNATVGMTVGVIEVMILQPFNYAKNMVQQGQPINLNPVIWYRGVGANCVNMGSCTMIQFAVGGRLKSIMTARQETSSGFKGQHLSLAQEMTCGVGAGVTSALIGSPLELIMIQQQRKGGSTVATVKNIVNLSPTTFGRGFVGAAVREGLWTCGYLAIPPVVRRNLMEKYPEQFPDNNRARVPAALLGGLFACYLTHPFDTIKTCMQGDIERKSYNTFSTTARGIYSTLGIRGFYRGATFRYGRMVCAVFIMDLLREKIAVLMYPSAFESVETPNQTTKLPGQEQQ